MPNSALFLGDHFGRSLIVTTAYCVCFWAAKSFEARSTFVFLGEHYCCLVQHLWAFCSPILASSVQFDIIQLHQEGVGSWSVSHGPEKLVELPIRFLAIIQYVKAQC